MKIKILLVFVICFSFLTIVPVSAITFSESEFPVSLITSSDAQYAVSALATSVSTYDDLISPNSYTDFLFNYYLVHSVSPLNDFIILRSNQYEYTLVSFKDGSPYAYIYTLNYTNNYDSSYIINISRVSYNDLFDFFDVNHFVLASSQSFVSDFAVRAPSYINMIRDNNIYLCYLFILILFIFYVFRVKYNPHKKVLS